MDNLMDEQSCVCPRTSTDDEKTCGNTFTSYYTFFVICSVIVFLVYTFIHGHGQVLYYLKVFFVIGVYFWFLFFICECVMSTSDPREQETRPLRGQVDTPPLYHSLAVDLHEVPPPPYDQIPAASDRTTQTSVRDAAFVRVDMCSVHNHATQYAANHNPITNGSDYKREG